MNLLEFALYDFDDAVEDESGCNTVGDAVAERHEDARAECRDSLFKVGPVDLLERTHHHDADDHKGRRRCGGRNAAGNRGEERAEKEHDGRRQAGQAGAPARADACSALNISRCVGRAEDRADGSRDGVGKQGAVHLGFEAPAGRHGLHVGVGKNAGAAARTDECPDRVKGVGKAECEDRHDDQQDLAGIGKQGAHSFRAERGAERCSQLGERSSKGTERNGSTREACYPHRNADNRRCDDPNQNRALDVQHQQHDDQNDAEQSEQNGRLVEGGDGRNHAAVGSDGSHAGVSGLCVIGLSVNGCYGSGVRGELDQVGILQADIRHKDADAAADGVLDAFRDGLDDQFAETGNRDGDVDQTADEHHGQGLLPGKVERHADRVGEECVQAHARGLRVRDVGEQRHDKCADRGSDDRRKEDRLRVHACFSQYLWVDEQDVRHGEECRETGDDLGMDVRAAALQVEEVALWMCQLGFAFPHNSFLHSKQKVPDI